jgi:ACS family tartrate transporter-like MFS transporter
MNEQQIFAKCAWRLIPFMGLLYVVSYVDRTNVAFAALTMNKDLGFSPAVFGFGAGIFFFSYALFQVPANVVLVRLGARRWMFCILAVWGAVSCATAFVQGPASFYALRFLLGVAEAGFFPGMIFYLTLWFPQAYRARYCALFMAAQPLAFIIGAPVSGLILGMVGVGGFAGWQWLFLIEGLPACVLAFAVLSLLPDRPADSSWLTTADKKTIDALLSREDIAQRRELWPALRDPRVIALGVAGFGESSAQYGILLWLPQIVHGMGFSNRATGFVVAMPFVAGMVATIVWGRHSDAKRERIRHVAYPFLLAAAGLLAASLAQSYLIVLLGLTLGVVGLFATMGPFWIMPSSFLGGTAAAGGVAFVRTIGAMGGFFGPGLIGVLKGQTGGYSAAMAALGFGLVLAAAIVLALGLSMQRGARTPQVQIAGGT